jgi:AcrR family transcriptional regulator
VKSAPSPSRRRRRRTESAATSAAPARIDVAGIRREQIVDAAAGIIASRGIQHLSLSAIEAAAGMSRGQLTYYFPTKEDILLAVFDRTVRRMQERMAADEEPVCTGADDVWRLIETLLTKLLMRPIADDFAQLQYSFLAQTKARPDFRERLASLYEQWRSHMADGFRRQPLPRAADPRLLASFVQALLHGLVMQLQADAKAFDRAAMFGLCSDLLGRLIGGPAKIAAGSRGANGRSHSPPGGRHHVRRS